MVTPERSSMLRCTARGFRITDGRFSSALASVETTATPNEQRYSELCGHCFPSDAPFGPARK
jgi:hypothetical protein